MARKMSTMVRIRSPQDLGAALVFGGLGLTGLWASNELAVGSAARMGPGYMPILLSWCLIGFATLLGLRALIIEGLPIGAVQVRSNVLIIFSILLFPFLLNSAGFALAVFGVAGIAGFATREANWREIIPLCFFLSAFCVLIFVYALKLPIEAFGVR
jgi:hypothetical protein